MGGGAPAGHNGGAANGRALKCRPHAEPPITRQGGGKTTSRKRPSPKRGGHQQNIQAEKAAQGLTVERHLSSGRRGHTIVDLNCRPLSFFWPPDIAQHLLTRLPDAEPRATRARLLDSGRHDKIAASLANSALTDADRAALAKKIDPAVMGGRMITPAGLSRYLPDCLANEVIIAHIELDTTTRDLTSSPP